MNVLLIGLARWGEKHLRVLGELGAEVWVAHPSAPRRTWGERHGVAPARIVSRYHIPFGGNDHDFNERLLQTGMDLAVATWASSFHQWGVSTKDAVRLNQFDVGLNQPRFRQPPPGVEFREL